MSLFFKDEDGDIFEETRSLGFGENTSEIVEWLEDDDSLTPEDIGFLRGFEGG